MEFTQESVSYVTVARECAELCITSHACARTPRSVREITRAHASLIFKAFREHLDAAQLQRACFVATCRH
jgi:hypothetical protein